MAIKLGTLLVREGVISAQQLEEALRIQVLYGGRLGTNLVELHSLDPETLGQWLSKQCGLPLATDAMLGEATEEAIQLIPADIAERFECFPFRKDGRKLHIAMVNPSDLAATDALTFKTGLRIVPYVVPELVLYAHLERRYGLARKLRYVKLSQRAESGPVVPAGIPRETPSQRTPALDEGRNSIPPTPAPSVPPPSAASVASISAPVPSTPPPVAASIPPPQPASVTQRLASSLPPLPSSVSLPSVAPVPPSVADAPTLRASTVSMPPGFGPGSTPPPVRAREVTPPPPIPFPAPPSRNTIPPVPAPQPTSPSIDVQAVIEAIQTATTREQVAAALLAFAPERHDTILLFVVREDFALGWKGRGLGVDDKLVDCVMLPLSSPSMFQEAVHQKKPVVGPVADVPLHGHFFRALGRNAPPAALVVPVIVHDRAVNLIYVDRLASADVTQLSEALTEIAKQVAMAYERILRQSKRAAGMR